MPNPISSKRNHLFKKAGKLTKVGGSITNTTIAYAEKSGTVKTISALATGTAVSSTGIGLLIASGALTLAGGALAAKSAVRTSNHIRTLNWLSSIRGDLVKYPHLNACNCNHASDHSEVVDRILPYILAKKRAKLHRKVAVASTLGVAGTLETARAISKGAYKLVRGTKGKNRRSHAFRLAIHFKSFDCKLTDLLVQNLLMLTDNELDVFRGLDLNIVSEMLEQKMKST